MSETATKRVNVTFSMSTYNVLAEIARERGKTMAEVLRDAIALEKWVHDEIKRGHQILVNRGGEIKELVIR